MELQTIFNMVIQHLVRQGKASVNDELSCMYRGEGGTKCAVGYLISDNNYMDECENNNVNADEVRDAITDTLGVLSDKAFMLLSDLQSLHDNEFESYSNSLGSSKGVALTRFVRNVEHTAGKYNLIVPRALYDFCKAHAG